MSKSYHSVKFAYAFMPFCICFISRVQKCENLLQILKFHQWDLEIFLVKDPLDIIQIGRWK